VPSGKSYYVGFGDAVVVWSLLGQSFLTPVTLSPPPLRPPDKTPLRPLRTAVGLDGYHPTGQSRKSRQRALVANVGPWEALDSGLPDVAAWRHLFPCRHRR
jgi:hypothetical protein